MVGEVRRISVRKILTDEEIVASQQNSYGTIREVTKQRMIADVYLRAADEGLLLLRLPVVFVQEVGSPAGVELWIEEEAIVADERTRLVVVPE